MLKASDLQHKREHKAARRRLLRAKRRWLYTHFGMLQWPAMFDRFKDQFHKRRARRVMRSLES